MTCCRTRQLAIMGDFPRRLEPTDLLGRYYRNGRLGRDGDVLDLGVILLALDGSAEGL